LRYQVRFRQRELEHEVVGEAGTIATNGLIDPTGHDSVQRREIRVEHDPLAADDMDPGLDPGGDGLGGHSGRIGAGLLISGGMDKAPPINSAASSEEHESGRARRWQTERLRALADRIEAGEFEEASQADIDAIFRA